MAIAALAMVLSLRLPVPEFVELQRMTDEQVRARLDLPGGCKPRLTALADPPGRVLVVITCNGERPDMQTTGQP